MRHAQQWTPVSDSLGLLVLSPDKCTRHGPIQACIDIHVRSLQSMPQTLTNERTMATAVTTGPYLPDSCCTGKSG
jgi:hypothetical protein